MTNMPTRNLLMERLSIYSQPVKLLRVDAFGSICKERRFTTIDRRQCHTYLADDRRSGFADRRKRMPYIPDLVDVLRRKRRSQN